MKTRVWFWNVAACLGLAFILFLLILFSTRAAANSMLGLDKKETGTELNEWRFVFSDDKEALDGDITQWKLATQTHPIYKPLNAHYLDQSIRLHTTLSARSEDCVLEIVTNSNPVKIWLDGEEIYNNRYDTNVVTGNRVNVISLPVSYADNELDIFLRVPFAYAMQARLTTPDAAISAPSLLNMLSFVGSGVVIAIGLLMMLLLFLFSLKSNGLGAAICLSLVMSFTGAGAFLSHLAFQGSTLTTPLLWIAQTVMLLITATGLVYTAVAAVNGFGIAEKLTVGLLLAYTLLYSILMFKSEVVGTWMMLGTPVLLLFSAWVIILRLSDTMRNRNGKSLLVVFTFMTAFFCEIYDSLSLLFGWGNVSIEIRFFAIVIYCITVFSVLILQALNVNVRLSEREQQIERDTECVKKTVNCCTAIFAQKEIPDFCIETAKSVKELILADQQNEDVPEDEAPPVRISMALTNEGRFEEIYNENQTDSCNYDRILERIRQHKGPSVVFGNHSLDMLLHASDTQLCIIHVEGIHDGLSASLQNIILSAYTGISAALGSLGLKLDLVEMQENVFINLAEIVEQKSSGTGMHLRAVADMVGIMCDEMGIDEHEKHIISMASMVHDIGKLAIPDAIISKAGKLTEDEFAIMQDHIIYGYNIMSKSPGEFMSAAAIIAQQHHEKYDGTGYLELKGEQIHLYARITSIADVFDALLSSRAYKQAWPVEKAYAYINEQSGIAFDPQIVAVFNRCADKLSRVKQQYNV